MAPLGSTMIAVALPAISRDIGAEASALTQWLVASYLITSIALQSPGGKLGDRIGHRRALIGGLSLVAAGAVLGSLVDTMYALGAARILMAAGGAATVPATMAILRNQTTADRRARVFGLFGASMGLAAAVGPLVGGELTELFGWRAVYAANLPVVAVSMILVLRARGLASSSAAADAPLDWTGSLLLATGLTLSIVALRVAGPAALWLGATGVTLLVAFPFWERRVPSPVVDFSLFRNRVFLGGGSIIALQNMAMYPLLFQLPVFFDRVRHVGARSMGQALLALTGAMIVSSLTGGRLAEIIGARAQTLIGSLLAFAGVWWLGDLDALRAPLDAVPGMLLVGAGVGLTSPPAQAASMSAVGREHSGMAGGMMSTLRYIGGVAGTTALGALLLDPGSPASHQAPMFVYAGALIVAAGLALTLPGKRTLKSM